MLQCALFSYRRQPRCECLRALLERGRERQVRREREREGERELWLCHASSLCSLSLRLSHVSLSLSLSLSVFSLSFTSLSNIPLSLSLLTCLSLSPLRVIVQTYHTVQSLSLSLPSESFGLAPRRIDYGTAPASLCPCSCRRCSPAQRAERRRRVS